MTGRLDAVLASLGLAKSRSAASQMIKNGQVAVDGKTVLKPSFEVTEGADVSVSEGEIGKYVSRGGLKLEKALDFFGIDVTDAVCCDIGASTGGFTDCLLKHGASKVYAVDSGTDQLDPSLRGDGRVTIMEQFNAKQLSSGTLGQKTDVVTMDVSFISQTKLYGAVCSVLKSGGTFISLIKPQFEVGKSRLGKGGIVRSAKDREDAVKFVTDTAGAYGLRRIGVTSSPIQGGDGNVEFLAAFTYTEKEQ